jgi:hypothetical protein
VPGNDSEFGVHRKATTGTGNALANAKAREPWTQLLDSACRRISQRHRLVQPRERRSSRAQQTLPASSIHNLLQQIGAGAGLSHEAALSELDYASFCPCRDQAGRSPNQGKARSNCRNWDLNDRGRSTSEMLKELSHFDWYSDSAQQYTAGCR